MGKIANRLFAFGLILSMVFPLVACNSSEQKSANTSMGEVWSAPSTVKIMKDEIDYSDKGEASLSYQAVRDEYESCQLIITADKEISYFELKTSDLKCDEDTLSADNISVYVQKYIPYGNYSGNGFMPDALIPMKVADEYEENKIAANKNGALWITVYIPEDTETGLYEGTFELVMKGQGKEDTLDIPVSVEVQDFTLPKEVNARTLFSWRYDRVAAGELDGSIEMMEYYYDFFQDYRISLQSLPIETLTGEEYINALEKYYDQITSYCILSEAGDISGNLVQRENKVLEQILAVASISSIEKNYFEKAMIYCIDEPVFTDSAERKAVVTDIEKLNVILQKCVDAIEADKSKKFANFKQIDNWRDCILNIPNVIPMGVASVEWLIDNEDTEEAQKLLALMNCTCPGFDTFTEELSAKIVSLFARHDIEVWWYGCMNPEAPAATYHLGDKNLLSARTISWLQKKYQIVGNLYWDAAAYTSESGESYDEYINVYETPYRDASAGYPAGDGFLAYPGEAYGVYGPLPSIRLMSIRDGMEEYEILSDIENKFNELSDTFGAEFSVENAMNAFYQKLYYGGYYMYADGESGLNFKALRSELINLAVALQDGSGFAMGNISIDGTNGTFTYYVQEGATVTIDDKVQQPISGLKYEYTMNVEKSTDVQVKVTNANGKSVVYNRFVGNPIYIMNDLSDNTVLKDIKVSEGCLAELSNNSICSTDGTSIHFNVKGKVTGNELIDAAFTPFVSLSTSLFGKLHPSKLSNINIDVFNPGETFKVKVRLYSGSTYLDFGDKEIISGKSTLTLDIKSQTFKQLDTADRLVFEFVNAVDNQPATYEFYLDNIVGEK